MKLKTLNKNFQFLRAYRSRKCFVSPLLVTYVVTKKGGGLRLGITTGKKVGGAVERNRARRVIEAAVRENLQNVCCTGADIVFVARSRTVLAKSQDVAAVMKKHFKAGGLIPQEKQ